MSKQILIYKLKPNSDLRENTGIPEDFSIQIWKPTLFQLKPPDKGVKYIMYWFFNLCKVFKNKGYSSVLLKKNQEILSSFLVVPKYYKWPFMENEDLQFTYVITNPEYRKKGYSEYILKQTINKHIDTSNTLWWVTDNENKASVKLATKLDFKLCGYGKHKGLFKRLIMVEKVEY